MNHLILILLTCLTTTVSAQEFETLFGNLDGQDLMDAIQSNYTTDSVMSYSMARDTLFANIWAKNDTLECVYSGWKRYLDPDLDPTQAVFTSNGGNEDINTEHSYPRSMGALEGTPGHSDMHHLFPTRVAVNSARGNDIYRDIPDNQAQRWFYSNQTQSNPPSTSIDDWAEDTDDGFEPREEFKGDVARAIFYFYTIYQDLANSTAPEFFEMQRNTLCQWSAQDPAEQDELVKTYQIAGYQGDIPNPFVIDCSLAERLYCQETVINPCVTVSVEDESILPDWTLSPNPSSTHTLRLASDHSWTHVTLYDNNGTMILTLPLSPMDTYHVVKINTLLPAATYQVQLSHRLHQTTSKVKTWVKL